MTDLVQLVVSGCATGSVYALAALGFTLLWQASGSINFAQGEFVMLPAFAMLLLMAGGLPLPLAFLATCVLAVVVLGWGFKALIADRLLRSNAGTMPMVVATIGLAIAMRNGVRAGFSAEAWPFPRLFSDRVLELGGVVVTVADLGTLAVALLLVLVTQLFLGRTITGRAMQACAQNAESAAVLGIPVQRMVLGTFAINAVLACGAALLIAPVYLAKFDMGETLGVKAFFAAIIGGFNNTRGALLGGIVVGVAENLAAGYLSQSYKDAVALLIFMAVILFKPEGLLGTRLERKV